MFRLLWRFLRRAFGWADITQTAQGVLEWFGWKTAVTGVLGAAVTFVASWATDQPLPALIVYTACGFGIGCAVCVLVLDLRAAWSGGDTTTGVAVRDVAVAELKTVEHWIAAQIGPARLDKSPTRLGRMVKAGFEGRPSTERVIIDHITITNRSPLRVASLTAKLSAKTGRLTFVGHPATEGLESHYTKLPVRLGAGDTISGPIAFDVPMSADTKVESYSLELADQMHEPTKVAKIPVPGEYP